MTTQPARILIIDDEAPIRRFLRVALEAQAHHVTEAATGRAGIEAAALTTPEAVILDLGLPDLDGRDVLVRLREWSQVPVLILSVRADEAEKVALLDAGAQDYVTKPFGIGELLARLRGILRDRRAPPRHTAPSCRSPIWRSTLPRIPLPRRASRSTSPARNSICCGCWHPMQAGW